MPQTPKDPSVMTLEELGREMRLREDSHQHLAAKAEFNLRQMRAQIEATEAQNSGSTLSPSFRAHIAGRFARCGF
jgi:hypothetical protein